jgi:hypothetical protein
MIEWPRSETSRKGRGGRRPSAGRKPNHLKQLVARRHPQSETLGLEEFAMLLTLTGKLAEPSSDGPRNQKESNTEAFQASPDSDGYRTPIGA